MTTKLYNLLKYERENSIGTHSWLGNLRWYVREQENNAFTFYCISALDGMSHEDCIKINTTKELISLKAEDFSTENWVYGADYIKTDSVSFYMPFYEYGGYINSNKTVNVSFEGTLCCEEDLCIVNVGEYYLCLKTDGDFVTKDNSFAIEGKDTIWTAVSFNIDKTEAIEDCLRLYAEREEILESNTSFWEEYLNSCPTVSLESDFYYKHPTLNFEESFKKEDFIVRQLWHYWCLLVNVSDVKFNSFPLYMAPDKINWIGTWSNDGPQCMAALSLTNQKELAKRLIISYMTSALTSDGIFSWYMHADGVGCYGTKGDVGRYSHGAPYLPHMVNYYIKNTDDADILSADVGGITVYEKLKNYILNLHKHRDMNNDSLIEWSNLWETGWDDKGGTFFSDASIEEWMTAVAGDDDTAIADFYAKNQRPVIAIVEQVLTLWSLSSMKELAALKNDSELQNYCEDMYNKMITTVNDICWNEKDGFYYDIDVKTNTQTTEKCADAFYWFNFEDNKARQESLLSHMNNENEFNRYYIPMLSIDSKGFNRKGYWSGGHWSREMSIIAMGLHHCGYNQKAMELLVRAIMSEEGNIIAEVIDPLDGIRSSAVTKMACAIMNMIALLDVNDKFKWNN